MGERKPVPEMGIVKKCPDCGCAISHLPLLNRNGIGSGVRKIECATMKFGDYKVMPYYRRHTEDSCALYNREGRYNRKPRRHKKLLEPELEFPV